MFTPGKDYLGMDADHKVDFKAKYRVVKITDNRIVFKRAPIYKGVKAELVRSHTLTLSHTQTAHVDGLTVCSDLEAY